MISRRSILAATGAFAATAALGAPSFAQEVKPLPKPPTPDQALEWLREGNRKFARGEAPGRDKSEERRQALTEGQNPFATLVCCSDSRVPPELLFGRGLGELFVVRNAGNVFDTVAMGSIEYAVAVLKSPLIVVLGHQKCGAVEAAINVVLKGTNYPGSIGRMIEPIIPAVLAANRTPSTDLLEAATRANVARIVHNLRTASEPMLMEPLRAGTLRVVGATYSLAPGEVDFFDLG